MLNPIATEITTHVIDGDEQDVGLLSSLELGKQEAETGPTKDHQQFERHGSSLTDKIDSFQRASNRIYRRALNRYMILADRG